MSAVEYLKRVLGEEATLSFQFFGAEDRSPAFPPYLGIAEAETRSGSKIIFDAYEGDSPEAVARVALAAIHDWIDRVPDYDDSFRIPSQPVTTVQQLPGVDYGELAVLIGADAAPGLSKSAQKRRGVAILERLWQEGRLIAHIFPKESNGV